jgi:predicted outer membrane repeat protein
MQAGGAVYVDAAASTTHVSVCEFRGNRVRQTADSAEAVGGAGGALYVQLKSSVADADRTPALVRVEQTNFTDNASSGLGGSILLLASGSDLAVAQLEVELTDCRLMNSSAAAGGAVYAENIHRLLAARTVFADSSAVGSSALGGALLVRRVPQAESSLQRRRRLLYHVGDDVTLLGMLSDSDSDMVAGSDVDSNSRDSDSDMVAGSDVDSKSDSPALPPTVSLEWCDFMENALELDASAQDGLRILVGSGTIIDPGMGCGAGVAVVAAPTTAVSVRVVAPRFHGNRATDTFDGGGMCIGGAVHALVEDAAFDNNMGADGGAITVKHSSMLSIQSSSFSHNTATGDGGAILVASRALLAASDVQFDHNVASVGAGVYVDASASVVLERLVRAEGNVAANNELVFGEVPVHCTNCTSTISALAACERWQSLLEDPTVQGAPHTMHVYRATRSADTSAPTLELWGESMDVANTERLGLLFTVEDVLGAPMCAWKQGFASATLTLHDMVGAVTLGGQESTRVLFEDGSVDASQLIVEGAFNDTATLTVSLAWTSGQGDEFSLQRDVSLRVRPCFSTEYVVDGVCRKCGDGFLIQDPVRKIRRVCRRRARHLLKRDSWALGDDWASAGGRYRARCVRAVS